MEVEVCWREEGETEDKEGVDVIEERRDLGEREGEVPPGRSSWGRGESESGGRREEEETDCEEGRDSQRSGRR